MYTAASMTSHCCSIRTQSIARAPPPLNLPVILYEERKLHAYSPYVSNPFLRIFEYMLYHIICHLI